MKHFLGKDHYLGKEVRCPLCNHQVDGASGIDHNDTPSPGDYGVCIGCASPLVYTDDLYVRAMTQKELLEMHPDNRVQIEMAMATVRMVDRRKLNDGLDTDPKL